MATTNDSEGREFMRCRLRARGEVRLPSGVLLEGRTQDISLKGVWFATERSLPVGNSVRVCLSLHSGDEQYHIETQGVVVRVGPGGVGIEFTEIDSASIEHLRNLVLFNTEDAVPAHDRGGAPTGLRHTDA